MKGTSKGLPKDLENGVVNAFDRQCFGFGDEAALEVVGSKGEVEEVGYSELQQYSLAVGAQLRHRFGVCPLDKVLLLCPDTCVGAQLSSMLACARIRAVFVPIDLSWLGTAKLTYIVRETEVTVAVVVADKDTDPNVKAMAKAGVHKTLYVQPSGDLVYEQAMDVPSLEASAKVQTMDLGDIMYLLYTSGSSSLTPKGVQGTEISLLNRIAWQREIFPYIPGERACKRSPFVFVDAMAELLAPLLSGIPLLASSSASTTKDIVELGLLAAKNSASRITMLPSQLALMLSAAPPKWPSLRYLVVSGEPLHVDVAKDFLASYPQTTLVNLYGSTEVAGDVSYYTMTSEQETIAAFRGIVSIGTAIHNCEIMICKEELLKKQTLCEASNGVHGELAVSGIPLAKGYLGDGRVGAFFAEDGADTRRVYSTGDRAVILDGLLYYLGRTDQLVKINGARVSMEEAEYNIRKILKLDPSETALVFTGSKLALFIASRDSSISSEALLDTLRPQLPKQQLPSIVRLLSELPRTVSGKCDKQKLKQMIHESQHGREPITHNSVERLVLQVLSVESLNLQRTLEENGGDSAALIQLRWKLKQALGLSLDLDALQRYTIHELCKTYEQQRTRDVNPLEPSPQSNYPRVVKKRKRAGHPEIMWAVQLQRCVDAAPSYVASLGRIFVGSHGGDVVSVDCDTGQVIWKTILDSRVEAGVAYGESNGLVYVPTYFALDVEHTGKVTSVRNRGKLVAIVAATGNVAWEYSCKGEIKASPTVLDEYLLFGAYDRTLYVLQKHSGEKHASVALRGDVRASPVALNGNMICIATTAGSLEFLSTETWQILRVFGVGENAPVFATPALDEKRNSLVYTAVNGCVECLSIAELPRRPPAMWSFQCQKALFTSPTIIGDRVLFGGHDGTFRAVHLTTGELDWAIDLGSVIYADPFKLDADMVVVATTKGDVSSVSIETGEIIASLELPGEVYSSGCSIGGSFGEIVIGCRDNYVRQIKMV